MQELDGAITDASFSSFYGLAYSMGDDRGYRILAGEPPMAEIIQAVKEVFSTEISRRSHNGNAPVERLGWTPKCEKLLHDGIDLSNEGYLEELLHVPYENAKLYFADVVVWPDSPPKRFRAGPGMVFIYKAVEGTLSSDNGFPMIVEGSYNMNLEQAMSAKPTPITLSAGNVLILDGALYIEYPPGGGGWGLVKVLKKSDVM